MINSFNWQKLQNGSDMRGVALEGVKNEAVNLTPDVTAILGKAFVCWLAEKLGKTATELVISIGRDSRLSGPVLMEALRSGMGEMGSRVYDFDLASTPTMFVSTIHPDFACDGAIMLTASHLPFNNNLGVIPRPLGRKI